MRKKNVFCVLLCLMFAILKTELLPGTRASESVAELLMRNQESVSKLHAFTCEIELEGITINGQTVNKKAKRVIYARDLIRNFTRQQIWNINLPQTHPKYGVPLNCSDSFITNDFARSVLNWDWQRSRPIVPSNQGAARAFMGKPSTHESNGGYVDQWRVLLFGVGVTAELPWMVKDFVQNSKGPKIINGKIQFPHPNHDSNGPGAKTNCELGFNSNGLVDYYAFEFTTPDGQLRQTETITKFAEPISGVFFPEEVMVEFKRTKDNFISFLMKNRISNIRVNEQVPEIAFDFRFPENVVVVDKDLKDGQTKFDIYLWGSDNQPKKKLKSWDELDTIDIHLTPTATSRQRMYYLYGLVTFIVGAGFFYAYRRRGNA